MHIKLNANVSSSQMTLVTFQKIGIHLQHLF